MVQHFQTWPSRLLTWLKSDCMTSPQGKRTQTKWNQTQRWQPEKETFEFAVTSASELWAGRTDVPSVAAGQRADYCPEYILNIHSIVT